MGVADSAKWVKEQRQRLGWSAAELADRARKYAVAAGFDAALKQQSISAFENGTAKRLPHWLQFVEAAFREAEQKPGQMPHEPIQFVQMQVALPSEAALARMFEGLLRPVDHQNQSAAELAQILARRLPTGLAQLRDLLPAPSKDGSPERDADPQAPATDRPVSRQ